MYLFVYFKVGTLTLFVAVIGDAQCSAWDGSSTQYLLVECCGDPDKVQGGKRGYYVVKILACSITVPATMNPKVSPFLLLTPCMNSSQASQVAQW